MNQEEARPEKSPAFRLGSFLIWPDLNRIENADQVVQVEPRIMQVLVCLARRHGRVISRNALLDEVWHEVVVSDEALTVAVSELRRILGDDPHAPRFIETIRKGGYRLIASVEPAERGPDGRAVGAEHALGARRHLRWAIPLAAVTVVIGLLALRVTRRVPETGKVLLGVPVTASPGMECDPALSWDGTRVAFAWDGAEGKNWDIYVKQRGSDAMLRLTSHPAVERYPVWSPDGATIAFTRSGSDGGIYLAPSLGGSERRVAELRGLVSGIDWSPDGRSLLFSAADSSGGLNGLRMLDLETLEVRSVTDPSQEYSCDYSPRFSPDGRTIAFARSQHPTYEQDLFVMPTEGGTPRRLTTAQRMISGLTWVPSGQEILFAAAPTAESRLWRVDLNGHDPVWVPTVGSEASWPTIAHSADIMVYGETSSGFDIWRLGLTGGGIRQADRPLIQSTRSDFAPCWSPQGDKIAFISTRSGHREIWVCGAAGEAPQQVTTSTGHLTCSFCWSPDAQRIAYSCLADGWESAHVVELDSRQAHRIRPAARHQVVVAWSSDGRWIYFNTQRDGKWQIGRMRSDGSIEEEIGPSGRTMTTLLNDPERIVFMKTDLTGFWVMSPITGQEDFFIDDRMVVSWSGWAVAEGGAYFLRAGQDGYVLGWYDSAMRESRVLGSIPGEGVFDLCLSPNGDAVLFARTDQQEADLILVDGFH